jgi:carboxyl-terminal processing protease
LKNSMKNKRLVYILTIAIPLLLLSGFFAAKSDVFFDVAKNIDIFTRIYKEIAFEYVDAINPEEFMRAGIRGMLSTLDPYTVFIDEKRQDDIDLLTNGKYGGIGVTIGLRDNNITIMEIIDGYSAQKQGLHVGDIITEVNGTKVDQKNFENISQFVKGEPGTYVKLKILREGIKDTLYFELRRDEVKLKNVAFAQFYPENSNYVYIKLTAFSRPAGEEIKNALLSLRKQKEIKGVIFDVRNNPGGLLDVAADICNRFLKKGALIVSTKGRDSASTSQRFANQEPLLGDIPLIILVNDGSASASEILAGAIQDHDRGVILGEKSFGKGLVQTVVPLSYNTSLKITTAKYFTPSGRCIQKINYAKDNPSIIASDTISDKKFYTDNKRVVYAAGGITPDTIVTVDDPQGVILDMLAKGVFFKFVNYICSKDTNKTFIDFSNDYLLSELKKFLEREKYAYISEFEKKFTDIIALSEKDKQFRNISPQLKDIKKQLDKTSSSGVEEYRKEILEEVKIELASRFSNSEGRIRESLKYDRQFQTAYSILTNQNQYLKLLSGK